MASIGVGAAAPDFTAFAPPGEADFTLSEHRGRPVVLMFVPLAFTSTCTAEFCHIAENWGQWGRLGADVVGISVDSPFVNRKWGEEMGAPFPILSDFNKDAAAAYGVLSEEVLGLRGVAKRSVFVVDGEGRITYAWVSENPGYSRRSTRLWTRRARRRKLSHALHAGGRTGQRLRRSPQVVSSAVARPRLSYGDDG